MRSAKIPLLVGTSLVVGGLIGGFLAWVVRGGWDEQFMLEGRFHVISLLPEQHDVTLRFPSGQEVHLTLNKSSSANFRLPSTGEGSIEVLIDGTLRDRVGYVTSMHNQVVLVITEGETWFSQIFPSLDTEQVAPHRPPRRGEESDARD